MSLTKFHRKLAIYGEIYADFSLGRIESNAHSIAEAVCELHAVSIRV
jgi:hypothetical protein